MSLDRGDSPRLMLTDLQDGDVVRLKDATDELAPGDRPTVAVNHSLGVVGDGGGRVEVGEGMDGRPGAAGADGMLMGR